MALLHACLQVLDTLNTLFARDKRGSIVGSAFVSEAGGAGSASASASTSASASASAPAILGSTSAPASAEPRNAPRDGLTATSPVLLYASTPSVRLPRARSMVVGKRQVAELRHELISSQAPSSPGTPPATPDATPAATPTTTPFEEATTEAATAPEPMAAPARTASSAPPTYNRHTTDIHPGHTTDIQPSSAPPRQQLRIEVPQHDRAKDGQAIFVIACQCDGQRWTVVRKERSVSELHAALQPLLHFLPDPPLEKRGWFGRGTAGLATQAQRLQEYLTELTRDGQWALDDRRVLARFLDVPPR
jgi:hypothetical protein